MADQTTLMGLLKTPSQIRKESQERLMEESLARSQMMLTRGGSTALPGIISAYGAQAAQRGTQAGAGLLRGVAGGIGQAVGGDMGQRISDLGVPMEERQARARQEAMAGLNMGDSQSLMEAAKKLSDMGDVAGAQSLIQQAKKLQGTELESALTLSKIQTEAARQADLLAKSNRTKEQIITEIQSRNPSIELIQAQTIAENALARSRTATAVETELTTPAAVALANKKVAAEEAGISLTNRKMALISSQISTEQVRKTAQEQNITESQAKTRLIEAEVDRYLSLTPGTIIEQAQQIEKLKAGTQKEKAQAQLAQARLADIGMTEFLREANQAGLTEEERIKLTRQRVEARARSGDVSGFGEKGIDTKLKLITTKIDDAQGAETAMSTATRVLNVVPDLSTGLLQTPKAIFAKIGSELGIDAAKQTAFANELFGVLKEGLVLEQAGNLKGALSDKDLKFLQNSIGGRELRPEVITEIFANLYYTRYADQKIAEYLDGKLGEFTDEGIRGYNVTEDTKNLRREFYLEAKSQLAIPTFDSAD
mgnify:CR=1 FL=1